MGKVTKAAPVLVETADLAFVVRAGVTVVDFLKQASKFFALAGGLERMAAATLAEAKALQAPTTAAEDAVCQRLALRSNAEKKEIETHWSAVTAALFAMHRKMTGARGRATDMEDQAGVLANRHHNDWTRRELERVRVENARLLEAQAEQDRITADEAAFASLFDEEPSGALAEVPFVPPAATVAVLALVEPNITAEGRDNTTWTAEVYDWPAFLAVFRAPGSTIPDECVGPRQAGLTELAKALKDQMNIPGVRAKSDTRVV